jgi:ABC-type phosphate transport system permease subunit
LDVVFCALQLQSLVARPLSHPDDPMQSSCSLFTLCSAFCSSISNTNISTIAVQSRLQLTTTTTVDSPSGVDAGVIAGAVFGTLYVIIVVSLIVYCFLKAKARKEISTSAC